MKLDLNGHEISLNPIRLSKKGTVVNGARVHIKGLGTVYVQVYEAIQRGQLARKAAANTSARHSRPSNPLPPRTVAALVKDLHNRVTALERAEEGTQVESNDSSPRPSA